MNKISNPKSPTTSEILSRIQDELKKFCAVGNIEFDPNYAKFLISLLARDARSGWDTNIKEHSECRFQNFLTNVIDKYTNSLDATAANIKLKYFFINNCKNFKLEPIREEYERKFQEKLKLLIDDVLQFPESSNAEQLEQMYLKMQVFIVAYYNIGCPKNHVLLKQVRQSLNSVIGRGDLQNYVMKKKYHRMEYLQRLSATVAGIVIFNNHGGNGDGENARNIEEDLKMAQTNTQQSFDFDYKRMMERKEYGSQLLDYILNIHINEKKVYCLLPIRKVRELNQFVILFNVYVDIMLILLEAFKDMQHRIASDIKKMECVIEKISDVLKFRTAIESELIFPHFVHLSEVWNSLILYLNYLAELNRKRAQIHDIVNEKLDDKFEEIVDVLKQKSDMRPKPIINDFESLFKRTNKRKGQTNLLKINQNIRDYCSLTIALTNGMLVPSKLSKKLCENLDFQFGFANIDYAKYAELNFEKYLETFNNSVYTSVDLILLCNLEQEILRQDFETEHVEKEVKSREFQTQTEMVVENDLSPPNWINVTWNAWDFHRETIHMAEIRKRQTHSGQSTLNYGQRNAQNQTYNTRRHI